MVVSIKQEIEQKLAALFPGCVIYSDAVPESSTVKSFLITLTGQSYQKRLHGRYESKLSFDVAYYSDKETTQVIADCLEVQTSLLRAFDLAGTYRVSNRQANIIEKVLHFKLDIKCYELQDEEYIKMQQMQAATTIL